jgi:hypothetical protein
MFIIIGVLFLAVGIGVTVCMPESLDLCLYCFKEDKLEMDFQFTVSYRFVAIHVVLFYRNMNQAGLCSDTI